MEPASTRCIKYMAEWHIEWVQPSQPPPPRLLEMLHLEVLKEQMFWDGVQSTILLVISFLVQNKEYQIEF